MFLVLIVMVMLAFVFICVLLLVNMRITDIKMFVSAYVVENMCYFR